MRQVLFTKLTEDIGAAFVRNQKTKQRMHTDDRSVAEGYSQKAGTTEHTKNTENDGKYGHN